MSDLRVRRRLILSALGTGSLAALAGCESDNSDSGNDDDEGTGNSDGTRTTDRPPSRISPSQIFTGEDRVFVVNGYSTSREWPSILQRKLDRYFDGGRVITVVEAIESGSPIVHWVDPDEAVRTELWDEVLAPALDHNVPVIALAQQSLQGAYGEFSEGIRGEDNAERIQRGVGVIDTYAQFMVEDGADHVVVATHIYKEGMEPEIGNERLALDALMERDPQHLSGGPDVWEPTRNHHPEAFADDRVHPNTIGAEIMAHYWFKRLLEIDGREVPPWSHEEMEAALGDDTADSAPSDVLHVAPHGEDDNPGTEDAPLASIDDAVSRAQPGDTVQVHPGEYFEFIAFREGGESDAPVTLTGPPEAVLKPPKDVPHSAIAIGASHVHITGLTVSGLYNPDEPENPDSYHSGKLIDLNTFAEDDDDYIEGLVISPHGIGGAGGALINSVQIKDCEIGGFEVIGPAGTNWILDDTEGHNGEILYLGTAPDNRIERGYEAYDRTRNIRVHHIDNSEGHPHSELVDCKAGVENVTVEYCTDGGGVQTHEGPYSPGITLDGSRCTVRWNVIRNVEGDGVRIGPSTFISNIEHLAEPETELERQMGKEHAIYGNVFTGCTHEAVNFLRESKRPGRDSNPLPEDQRTLCGNLYDGYSDDAPGKSCPSDLPAGEGVGHPGGDSPWSGDPPTKDDVFPRYANATHLDVTVHTATVPTDRDIEVPVTVTNNGADSEEVVFRLRINEHELATETVTVRAGKERDVNLTTGGISHSDEISVTRNGQKVGSVRITDDGGR